MRKKKSFVLLEVLIGLALVSVSILPFLRYPFRHMHQELEKLFEMQLACFAQERLVEIEVALSENEISEEFLFGEKNKKIPFSTTTQTIELPGGWKRTFSEKVFFKSSAQRVDDQNRVYSLVHIFLEYGKAAKFEGEVIAKKKQ